MCIGCMELGFGFQFVGKVFLIWEMFMFIQVIFLQLSIWFFIFEVWVRCLSQFCGDCRDLSKGIILRKDVLVLEEVLDIFRFGKVFGFQKKFIWGVVLFSKIDFIGFNSQQNFMIEV